MVAMFTVASVSVPHAEAKGGNRYQAPAGVYFRQPGESQWRFFGNFGPEVARRVANDLRAQGFQATIGR